MFMFIIYCLFLEVQILLNVLNILLTMLVVKLDSSNSAHTDLFKKLV